jgi:hypothetical protein
MSNVWKWVRLAEDCSPLAPRAGIHRVERDDYFETGPLLLDATAAQRAAAQGFRLAVIRVNICGRTACQIELENPGVGPSHPASGFLVGLTFASEIWEIPGKNGSSRATCSVTLVGT